MKQEFVKPWVDALRSGEYKQIHSRLQNEKGFCCLGVLCDILIKTKQVDAEWIGAPNNLGIKSKDEEMLSSAGLPKEVQKLTGISTSLGYLDKTEAYKIRHLAGLNDSGKSFDQIATIIEQEWQKL